MHHCFKKQLFGYRKKQVDEAISALEKNLDEIGARYEQRIAEVVEENVCVSVELKVARAGYQDAAEMMPHANRPPTWLLMIRMHCTQNRGKSKPLQKGVAKVGDE